MSLCTGAFKYALLMSMKASLHGPLRVRLTEAVAHMANRAFIDSSGGISLQNVSYSEVPATVCPGVSPLGRLTQTVAASDRWRVPGGCGVPGAAAG